MERMLMMQQEAETALLNSTTFPGFTTLSALEVFLLTYFTYLLPANICHHFNNTLLSPRKMLKMA